MIRSSAVGKNDGSVQGERYFDCKPKHGVFVRPSQVQIIEAPKTVSLISRFSGRDEADIEDQASGCETCFDGVGVSTCI
jgi:dynactin complex subunit